MRDFKAKVNRSTVLGRSGFFLDVQKDLFLALDSQLIAHQFSMEKKEDPSPPPSPVVLR